MDGVKSKWMSNGWWAGVLMFLVGAVGVVSGFLSPEQVADATAQGEGIAQQVNQVIEQVDELLMTAGGIWAAWGRKRATTKLT